MTHHTKILCLNLVVEIFEALHVDDRQSIIHNAPGQKNRSLKTKVINIQISLRDEPALNLHTEISRIIKYVNIQQVFSHAMLTIL